YRGRPLKCRDRFGIAPAYAEQVPFRVLKNRGGSSVRSVELVKPRHVALASHPVPFSNPGSVIVAIVIRDALAVHGQYRFHLVPKNEGRDAEQAARLDVLILLPR